MLYKPYIGMTPNLDLRNFARQYHVTKGELAVYWNIEASEISYKLWQPLSAAEKKHFMRSVMIVSDTNACKRSRHSEVEAGSWYSRQHNKAYRDGVAATVKHLAISLPMQKGGNGRVYTGQGHTHIYYEGTKEWD